MTSEQADLIRTLQLIAAKRSLECVQAAAHTVMEHYRAVWVAMQPRLMELHAAFVRAGLMPALEPAMSENQRRRMAWAARHVKRVERMRIIDPMQMSSNDYAWLANKGLLPHTSSDVPGISPVEHLVKTIQRGETSWSV